MEMVVLTLESGMTKSPTIFIFNANHVKQGTYKF